MSTNVFDMVMFCFLFLEEVLILKREWEENYIDDS